MNVEKKLFGRLPGGECVYCYTLHGSQGMQVSILNYGAVIQKLLVPSRTGRMVDVVSGYDDLVGYTNPKCDLGAVVGRYANRIAKGRFSLDGKEYTLFCNNGANHLHGGKEGFHHKLWEATALDGEEPAVALHYLSCDGEEGYPGNLSLTVTYTLKKENTLSIHYKATTDKKTVLNLTNHAYFNLGGFDSGKILSHELWMDSEEYLPVDGQVLPTGEILPVAGTPMDFLTPKEIGRDIARLDNPRGYDTCFKLRTATPEALLPRAELLDRKSGIGMKVFTDQPCIQLYTATFMATPNKMKGGSDPVMHGAVCLETQKMPDSPNHAHFTNTVLSPGEVFESTTAYGFITI